MYNNLSLSLLTPVLPAGELDTVCGTDHSGEEGVTNYKYICDGLLVSIIGCFGVIGTSSAVAFIDDLKLK